MSSSTSADASRWRFWWDTARHSLVIRRLVRWVGQKRIPVLLQMNSTECGAACLAMILTYHGRKTRVAECRHYMSSSRDGTTALALTQTARIFGLRTRAYAIEQLADFAHVQLPAIIHWGFNHFVVVERWTPTTVEIIDPSLGRRTLSVAEFGQEFTGVVLTFEPGIHFETRTTTGQLTWRTYCRALIQLPGMIGLLLQILLASFLVQGLGLALPVFTQILVDQVLHYRITNIMPMLGIGMSLLLTTQIVVGYLRSVLLIFLQARLDAQLMLGFLEHLFALPFRFFQQRSSGDLLMRLNSGVMIREVLTNQTISVLLDGGFVLGYLLILFTQAPLFAVSALSLGILQVLLLIVTRRPMHSLMQKDLAAQAAAQSYLVETLAGIAIVKASGATARALEQWSHLFVQELNLSLQRSHLSATIHVLLDGINRFAPLIMLWVGGWQVLNGRMTLGTALLLNSLAITFLSPLASLVANARQLQLVGAYLERISDVLDTEPEQQARTVQLAPQLMGHIELRNVSFRYAPDSPWVLKNISLIIAPGEKVALVGPSGSGKSTLALLLLGLYQPTEGEILFDGAPLNQFDYQSIRSQLGVVLQESFLFSGSVRRNIAFHQPDLTFEQVVAAASKAAIHDEIMAMPMCYETLIAEGGAGLSGGQRQRLALARALAIQPAVLLLDEATSHLDVVTEQAVEQHLNKLACTRIVIAHRLSTVRNADSIIVLKDGEIVEIGTHDTLLSTEGHYATLIRSQLMTDSTYQSRKIMI